MEIKNLECIGQNNVPNESNVSFVVKMKKQVDKEKINAHTVVEMRFDDNTAKQFEIGKKYKLTITDEGLVDDLM
jgi:hypothetical protein